MSDCARCEHCDDTGPWGRLCLWVAHKFPPPVLRKYDLANCVIIEIEPTNCPAFDEGENK